MNPNYYLARTSSSQKENGDYALLLRRREDGDEKLFGSRLPRNIIGQPRPRTRILTHDEDKNHKKNKNHHPTEGFNLCDTFFDGLEDIDHFYCDQIPDCDSSIEESSMPGSTMKEQRNKSVATKTPAPPAPPAQVSSSSSSSSSAVLPKKNESERSHYPFSKHQHFNIGKLPTTVLIPRGYIQHNPPPVVETPIVLPGAASSSNTMTKVGQLPGLSPRQHSSEGGDTKFKRSLPPTFVPTPCSVICGRGSQAFHAEGNRRFRQTAKRFLDDYAKASSKNEKSNIVSQLVAAIYEASPEGAFIKYRTLEQEADDDRGCWWEVSDQVAREKAGAQMRELLHTKYRSSTKAKQRRRKAMQTHKKE